MPGCLISDQRVDAAQALAFLTAQPRGARARGTKRVDLIIMNEEAAQHKTQPQKHHHPQRHHCHHHPPHHRHRHLMIMNEKALPSLRQHRHHHVHLCFSAATFLPFVNSEW